MDALAAEYADRVDFVAPAWKSSLEATAARAAELFASGEIMWGLDEDEDIFAMYGIPYQPVTILIASDRTVVDMWPGMRPESSLRQSIEELIEISGR